MTHRARPPAWPVAPPGELRALATGAGDIADAAAKGDWPAAADGLATLASAWHTYEDPAAAAAAVPALLATLAALHAA